MLQFRLLLCGLPLVLGCVRYRDDIEYDFPVEYVWNEPNYGGQFTLFQGVWWDQSLAPLIEPLFLDQAIATNRSVLDLFCGPGYVAVLCGRENARSVLSIAEGQIARACARYNVAHHSQDTVVTVRDLDLTQSPLLPETSQYELIFALLVDSEQSFSTVSIDRKLEILAECVRSNLSPSGRVFAVCENELVASKLKDVCHQKGFTATSDGKRLQAATVWEITAPAKPLPRTPMPDLPAINKETPPKTPILSTNSPKVSNL